MSFLPFFVVALGTATGALLTRRRPGLSLVVGFAGLVLAFLAALVIRPGETLVIGDGTIATTGYQRLFLVLGAGSGLAISIIGFATSWQRNVPAAILASLGWTGLALALPDPLAALTASVAAGLAGILVTLVAPIDERGVEVGARELRAVAVAGTLALIAIAGLGGGLASPGASPGAAGLAYLAIVVAVALRFGVIPFHAWAGRLSQSAPEAALPLLLAWAPAGFAVVALSGIGGLLAGPGDSLGLERGLVVALGAIGLLFGTFAVWIQDDLEHVVGYSIAQDAGFVILAFATPGPETWGPARSWILVFALAKTALAAWALVLRTTHGTRRIDHLRGWARRSPVLGVAFVLLVLATIGWPGSTAWAARLDLVGRSVTDPLRTLVVLAGLSSLVYYARLAGIGLRTPGDEPGGRAGGRLRWPRSLRRPADTADGAATAAAGGEAAAAAGGAAKATAEQPDEAPDGDGRPAEPVRPARPGRTGDRVAGTAELVAVARKSIARARRLLGQVGPAWHGNRSVIASLLVLVLAGAAFLGAAGWLGVPDAAGEAPPAATSPVSP